MEASNAAASQGGQRTIRVWQEWMMVAVGLIGVLSIVAIIVSIAAFAEGGTESVTQLSPATGAGTGGAAPAQRSASTAAPARTEDVRLAIKSDVEHGKRGPDGKWHDAFLPADFTVHAGDKVVVTVANYDDGSHSFTSTTLGPVNVSIPGGSATKPSETTFTFTAPSQPGTYSWYCAMPCDPWAMAHVGFMRGDVTVTA